MFLKVSTVYGKVLCWIAGLVSDPQPEQMSSWISVPKYVLTVTDIFSLISHGCIIKYVMENIPCVSGLKTILTYYRSEWDLCWGLTIPHLPMAGFLHLSLKHLCWPKSEIGCRPRSENHFKDKSWYIYYLFVQCLAHWGSGCYCNTNNIYQWLKLKHHTNHVLYKM